MERQRITQIGLQAQIVLKVAQRSTCPRLQVGALIVDKWDRIISTGYNGAPRALPHCTDVGCLIEPETGRCKRTVHAEVNAIINARQFLDQCYMVVTHHPCPECLPIIYNSGINYVHYIHSYPRGEESEIASFMNIFKVPYELLTEGEPTFTLQVDVKGMFPELFHGE